MSSSGSWVAGPIWSWNTPREVLQDWTLTCSPDSFLPFSKPSTPFFVFFFFGLLRSTHLIRTIFGIFFSQQFWFNYGSPLAGPLDAFSALQFFPVFTFNYVMQFINFNFHFYSFASRSSGSSTCEGGGPGPKKWGQRAVCVILGH